MKSILVVDNDVTLVESLIQLLEAEGYLIVSAKNGKGHPQLEPTLPSTQAA